jgi:hypothetical protein
MRLILFALCVVALAALAVLGDRLARRIAAWKDKSYPTPRGDL